jgi:hypothetical protein
LRLFVLAKRSFFAIVRNRLVGNVSFARRRNDARCRMQLVKSA